jgi:hypothetical protein
MLLQTQSDVARDRIVLVLGLVLVLDSNAFLCL